MIDEINLYNSMVMGMQNYYRIATNISVDCSALGRAVMTILTNRLNSPKGSRLVKEGRPLTKTEMSRYGKSKMLRYVAGTDELIYPVSYVQHKYPMCRKQKSCCYTAEGRAGLHDNLRINVKLMLMLMQQPLRDRSVEYADNRISLFSAQWGKCAVTGKEFTNTGEIHCHHKTPKQMGGTDKYENLELVLEPVHHLIHATEMAVIEKYLNLLKPNTEQLKKLNKLRELVGLGKIVKSQQLFMVNDYTKLN